MSHADDIGKLFERFGASADSYKEIESDFEYLEQPLVPVVSNPPAALETPVIPTLEARVAPEPVVAAPAHPEPVSTAPATVAPEAGLSLRERLEAAAHKRRAAADGLNRGALEQAMHAPSVTRPKARIVAVVSAKGGVGKTTFAATLARVLDRANGRTLALDLDPQNALAHHFGLNRSAPGLSQALRSNTRWDSFCHATTAGIDCLPFGHASEAELRAQEVILHSEPNALVQRLAGLGLNENDTLIIDTATGASPWLGQVLAIADVVVAVTLADAASYQVLDDLQARLAPAALRRYLVNQVDPSRALSLDMCEVLHQRLGDTLLNPVRLDYNVADALAFDHDPLQHTPQSPGCQDLRAAAHAIGQLLIPTASESQRS